MSKFKIYLKSILIPLIIGAIIGFLISGSIDYDTLEKPLLAPPSLAFPINWTILYVLMGVSYGVLISNSLVDARINFIYYLQLFFNALWPIAFFVLKWRLFALFWIIALAILIAIMVVKFYDRNKVAGLLQIPYLLWTLFATYLNLFIHLLNN